ncbi:sporulation protein [Nocardiopsis sp. NPDC049922]|uniref:sporulation protein n=1 Tax=Nocardiopsis sp. NPDC049922 TaxID=3155157 RepID=UPI0033EECFF2
MGHSPNTALRDLIELSGASRKALAHRINELAAASGHATSYTHTSVANWVTRGMVPRPPAPELLARALSERLGRPVSLAEIGLGNAVRIGQHVGLEFPRPLPAAIGAATAFWSSMDRRTFLSTAFTATAFGPPTLRWMSQPADEAAAHKGGGRRIGRADIAELVEIGEQARHADSRWGGGSPGVSVVGACLRDVAAPMLRGTYTDQVGRDLFAATAALGRLAGWTAFDNGEHALAQRHYVQALRMARAAGGVDLGGYVLVCMGLQASLRGFHDEALDMVEAALSATRTTASPRVRAFFHLIEARVHARTQRPRAAGRALAASENLLSVAGNRSGDDPGWIDFYTHARLAADAVEIHRDLGQPHLALEWNTRASMPTDRFARSYGLRLAVLATAHVQQGDLDAALPAANESVDVLSRVRSRRAVGYLHDLAHRLSPHGGKPEVRETIRRVISGQSPQPTTPLA